MIFVSVGMSELQFDRLVEKMDEIAPELGDEVVMQIGSSGYVCKNCESFDFKDDKEMAKYYERCDILVCHAGVGTIINGLKNNIPIVVVPRRMELDEVDTNHQFMIADELVKMGRGISVENVDDLRDAISKAKGLNFPPYSRSTELSDFLTETLAEVEQSRMKKG